MSFRLFAAISIPDSVADRLALMQRDVRGASWRPRECLHLTLAFYGDVDGGRARDLDEELAASPVEPFEARLSGVDYFGGKEPTALWAAVAAPCPALDRLAAHCRRAASRARIPIEARKFVPHVTLAYCHGTQIQEAAAYHQRYADFRTEPFWIEQFELYSSHGTKTGSRYVEEAAYPLGAG